MKAAAILAIALSAASLSGCAWYDDVPNPGNPNNTPYAGAPGSVYDAAANPARDFGQVAYNPYQPLDNNLPMAERLPAPTNANAVSSVPLTPPVGSPALGTRTR